MRSNRCRDSYQRSSAWQSGALGLTGENTALLLDWHCDSFRYGSRDVAVIGISHTRPVSLRSLLCHVDNLLTLQRDGVCVALAGRREQRMINTPPMGGTYRWLWNPFCPLQLAGQKWRSLLGIAASGFTNRKSLSNNRFSARSGGYCRVTTELRRTWMA